MTATTTTTENDDESDSFQTTVQPARRRLSNESAGTTVPLPPPLYTDVYAHYYLSSDHDDASSATSYSSGPIPLTDASYPYTRAHEGRRIITTAHQGQPPLPLQHHEESVTSQESPLDPYLLYLQQAADLESDFESYNDDDEDDDMDDDLLFYENSSNLYTLSPKSSASIPSIGQVMTKTEPLKDDDDKNNYNASYPYLTAEASPKRNSLKPTVGGHNNMDKRRKSQPDNIAQQQRPKSPRPSTLLHEDRQTSNPSYPYVTAQASPKRSPKPTVANTMRRKSQPDHTTPRRQSQPDTTPTSTKRPPPPLPMAPVLAPPLYQEGASASHTDEENHSHEAPLPPKSQQTIHTSDYCSDGEVSIVSSTHENATYPNIQAKPPSFSRSNSSSSLSIGLSKQSRSSSSLLSSKRSRSNSSLLSKRSRDSRRSKSSVSVHNESYPSIRANSITALEQSGRTTVKRKNSHKDLIKEQQQRRNSMSSLSRGSKASLVSPRPTSRRGSMAGGSERSATISRSLSASFKRSPSIHVKPSSSKSLHVNGDGGSENGSSIYSMEDDDVFVDFLQDPISEMTWGRRIALRLMNKKWYNPKADHYAMRKKYDDYDNHAEDDDEEEQLYDIPSLPKAWAYFEHVVLTRYFDEPDIPNFEEMGYVKRFLASFKNISMDRSQPGESLRKTKLYDPMGTPHSQLGDFGLGFGLYFSTVRAIGYITFVAGLISSFNMYFFASAEYYHEDLTTILVRGSAICTNTEWVPCVDCSCDNSTQGWDRTSSRCANVTREIEWPVDENTTITRNETVTFILKNRCLDDEGGFLWQLGLVNLGSVVFLLLAILALSLYLKDQTVKFDEDEQTAQDYSILISNPPPKATDPDVWKRFFETNFEGVKVAAITCAVNNDLLIRALVKRREVLRMMELQLDPGTPMDIDSLALLAAKEARKGRSWIRSVFALVLPLLPELLSRLVALNTSIKGLAQLSYPCTNVFVTFENEADQRLVLSKLAIGNWHVRGNNVSKLPDPRKHAFQGNHVLAVGEAVEPNSVRWQDLNVTLRERIDQMVITNILTGGSILVVALIVSWIDQFHVLAASFSIAAFNLGFPEFAKLIVMLESHPTESKVQTSLYFKIAVFRWVNTAIVITVITPFTHTLAADDGLIPQIYAIFFSEIITTNLIQLTDPWGHFLRHMVAPRASTQDSMNLLFQGLEVEIAERYTNMTKIMFLAFWYSSIFPGSLFLCSITLAVNYYTDRFSMMRTWKRAPRVSTEISAYSRRYFMSTACVILVAMSSFYWSAYPFDNLCLADTEEIASSNLTDSIYFGDYEFSAIKDRLWGEIVDATVELNGQNTLYRFCNQDFILKPGGPSFPFFYEEGRTDWMTEDQQQLAFIFGWATVATIGLMLLRLCRTIFRYLKAQFYNVFDATGDDQGIGFHEVTNISGYIPQVRSWVFSYPLIACKIDKIGEHLFDWTDPDRDYQYYDITKDADHVLTGTNRRARHSFSRMKHWPPEKQKQKKKKTIQQLKRSKRLAENRYKSVFNSNGIGGMDSSRHLDSSFRSADSDNAAPASNKASNKIRAAFPALFMGHVSEADEEDDSSVGEEPSESSHEIFPPETVRGG